MAAMLGAAGGGDLGALPLEQWFFEMPVCTRWWTTATVVTGLLVQCHILTPFQLFYSFRAVFVRSQVRSLYPLFPLLKPSTDED
jgi:Derlin-2/3